MRMGPTSGESPPRSAASTWASTPPHKQGQGRLVERLTPGSEADKAGIRVGDRVVVRFNTESAFRDPEMTVHAQVTRDGKTFSVTYLPRAARRSMPTSGSAAPRLTGHRRPAMTRSTACKGKSGPASLDYLPNVRLACWPSTLTGKRNRFGTGSEPSVRKTQV